MTPDIGYYARLQSTFGVDIESMPAPALRSSLRDLLTELERVNGYLDSYRADNERLAWDNSMLRLDIQKLRAALDRAYTNPQSNGD